MSSLLKQALKNQQKQQKSSDSEQEENDEVPELGTLSHKISSKIFSPIDFQTIFPIIDYLNETPIYFSKSDKNIILFCVHGAGLSAASFALLAEKVKPFASLVSFDLPKHGNSKNYTEDADLSLKNIVNLSISVLNYLIEKNPLCSIVLLGHSLGGSVVAKISHELSGQTGVENPKTKRHVVGLIVIDVVEGSAIDALPFMKNFVLGKKNKFGKIDDAIEYTLKSKILYNAKSARISVPTQIGLKDDRWVWKTDLLTTEKYWKDWFIGLNSNFLSSLLPKVLILAHQDRMDKELTIAQMQGRFKLVCLNGVVGHCLHEDDPNQMGDLIKLFLKQFHIPLSLEDIERIEKFGVTKFRNEMENKG